MDNDGGASNDIIRTYLKKVLEHVIAAGHNVREFSEFILDKFGATIRPYLRQFLSDVSNGEIKIRGLTEAAKTAIVGHHVNAQERESMVREEAYYLAEKRGFGVGHEAEDWLAAEVEIDKRLAEEAGLIANGSHVLALTAANIENELKKLKGIVKAWLEENYGSAGKARTTATASTRKAANTTSTTKKVSGQKKVRAKAVAPASEKAAKTPAKKVSAPKKGVKKEPA